MIIDTNKYFFDDFRVLLYINIILYLNISIETHNLIP